MPWPSMTAKPCTSASLIMRTGKPPSRVASDSASGMSCQPTSPKCGAVSMRLLRTTPGKPIEMHVGGCSATSGSTSLTSVSTSCSGVQGCGVATRRRSVSILPCASMIAAFSPVPPTSIARICSTPRLALLLAAGLAAALGAAFVAVFATRLAAVVLPVPLVRLLTLPLTLV